MESKSSAFVAGRRRWFVAAGTVGAAAAVASVVPATPVAPAQSSSSRPTPNRGGGYHVSAHVEHYYRTARI
jgi:hypothetical protein